MSPGAGGSTTDGGLPTLYLGDEVQVSARVRRPGKRHVDPILGDRAVELGAEEIDHGFHCADRDDDLRDGARRQHHAGGNARDEDDEVQRGPGS